MNLPKATPSFAMLRAFDAFGRSGGVRKAAEILEVDHTVVSRHLASLEAFVGAALIDRNNCAGSLTSDGAEYHRRISAALQEVANATLALRKRHDQHLLIWCSPGLAYHWLSPRLLSLSAGNIWGLELRPMDYGPNFSINEADGDIRYVRQHTNAAPAPGTRWVELASPLVFPVASPAYADSIKNCLRSAANLLDMRLLHEESDANWRLWFESQGLALPPATLPGPRLWHAHVTLDAARSGEGVALANSFVARDFLASGQLVVLQASETPFVEAVLGAYQFSAREDRWRSGTLPRFRNWLVQAASATPT